MGRKETKRRDHRETVMELIDSRRKLTTEEISFIKTAYTGAGGLVSSGWSHGQFFTPPHVVRFVHAITAIMEKPGPVLEPSAGAGAFLEGLNPSLCTAIEPSQEPYTVAKICYPAATLIHASAEEMFPPEEPSTMDGAFDYCIGNPPFGIKIRWSGAINSGRCKATASENVFMEIAVRAVRPGGKIAMLVPDGLLSNHKTQPVREWLMRNCYIRAVVSLPPETFYHTSTSVKCSVLYLEKFPQEMTHGTGIPDYQVFMAVAQDIGWDSRGRPTKGNDLQLILAEWEKHNKSHNLCPQQTDNRQSQQMTLF